MIAYRRRDGEDVVDYVQRFLADELCPRDATDGEIAEWLGVPRTLVAEQQSRRLALIEAANVANDLDWDGTLYELVHAALVAFALQACAEKRCNHPGCVTPTLHELSERGIRVRLVDGDRFVPDGCEIGPDERAWIVERRAMIVAELGRELRLSSI